MPTDGQIVHTSDGKVGRWDAQQGAWEDVTTSQPPDLKGSMDEVGRNASGGFWDALKGASQSRGLMSTGGGMAAGMAAAPFTEGLSIPAALGVEALSGFLGGAGGAGAARASRNLQGHPSEPLASDVLGGGVEGAITAGAGSALKGTGAVVGATGKMLGDVGTTAAGTVAGRMMGLPWYAGGPVADALINHSAVPRWIQGAGDAVRPSSLRSGISNLVDMFGGVADDVIPAATRAAKGAPAALSPEMQITAKRLREAGYPEDLIQRTIHQASSGASSNAADDAYAAAYKQKLGGGSVAPPTSPSTPALNAPKPRFSTEIPYQSYTEPAPFPKNLTQSSPLDPANVGFDSWQDMLGRSMNPRATTPFSDIQSIQQLSSIDPVTGQLVKDFHIQVPK